MVLVLVISYSSKCYDTLFSIDLKAKKRTITTACLVAVDGGAPAPAGTTTTASLVAANDSVPANVCLTDGGISVLAPLLLTWLQQTTACRLLSPPLAQSRRH
jgi:hypothetical protein